MKHSTESEQLNDIAIIGMALRLPGAKSVADFWRNLRDGVESVRSFSDDELRAVGITESVLADPHYVKASAVLDDIDLFDASFFGFSPREAEITDPQHRLFLECAWEALESAGYDSETCEGRLGVHAGAGFNTYLFNLLSRPEIIESVGTFQAMLGDSNNFLATLASYKLNLRGPGITVQTACSTSLVAVHLACQSLLNGESDMALAGGVFDQRAAEGRLHASGGGHQLARRALPRLRRQGGGNTGRQRHGHRAAQAAWRRAGRRRPHPRRHQGLGHQQRWLGQDRLHRPRASKGRPKVITEAMAIANVEPATVGYVETHGTGTHWATHRSGGADKSLPHRHRQEGLLRHRLRQDVTSATRCGGGRGGTHQDSVGA